ncbi:MAG TPA: L-threonylcarbamoyladenylate synthase [Gemmatimonadales bacterium]|nr:L-threonylcarbamoyladenylate synthase [Gemmatimonadales bacterium]
MILPYQTEEEISSAIPRVERHLHAGKLLAYPTETVYGLGSAPTDPALSALARLKGRPEGKPFLLLITGRRMAEEWGLVFSPSATALSDAFWPGPLTLVLRGGEGRLPEALRGREGGIAVRHTSHAGIARLVAALGMPLTSTSANRPGGPPAPGAERLAEVFGPEERSGELLVLDGGVLGNVPPSTLVDCTGVMPRLVREGAIPRAELRRAAGRLAP